MGEAQHCTGGDSQPGWAAAGRGPWDPPECGGSRPLPAGTAEARGPASSASQLQTQAQGAARAGQGLARRLPHIAASHRPGTLQRETGASMTRAEVLSMSLTVHSGEKVCLELPL